MSEQQQPQAGADQKKSWLDRSDILYIVGAALVVIGVALIRAKLASIAAGVFCLVFPVLELASGFIKGLRR
jgi:hypothetical protein